MLNLRAAQRYTPPDIALFKELGFGLLELARGAYGITMTRFGKANDWLNRLEALSHQKGMTPDIVADRWSAQRARIKGREGGLDPTLPGFIPDMVGMFAYWTEADDMFARLEAMSEDDRADHLRLDAKIDYEAAFKDHKKLTGLIEGWVRAGQNFPLQTELNRQLDERIREWKGYLAWAEEEPGVRPYSEEENEPGVESVGDFAHERDLLEYARLGLYQMRFEVGLGFRTVYLEGFSRNVDEIDERFRKVLGDKRALGQFWADRSWWWHWPAKRSDGRRAA